MFSYIIIVRILSQEINIDTELLSVCLIWYPLIDILVHKVKVRSLFKNIMRLLSHLKKLAIHQRYCQCSDFPNSMFV